MRIAERINAINMEPTPANESGPERSSGTARIVFIMPRCGHEHVRAVHKQARSLREAGYDVVLVAKSAFTGEYLGMRVVQARNSFTSLLRPVLNLPSLFTQALKLKGDIYVLRNPDTLLLALLLRLVRKPVIYDTHEDFSKRPLIYEGIPKWLRPISAKVITYLEKLASRVTQGVIVTQEHQPRLLGGRTLLQPNAPLTDGPVIAAARSIHFPRNDARISLIYAGIITRNRGILKVLDLLQNLEAESKFELELLGAFENDALFEKARRHPGWRHVRYHGLASHAETLSRMRSADIGLALLDAVADYPTTSITKIYEYMHAGIPFIASDFPAWRVQTPFGDPGLYIDPGVPEEFSTALLKLGGDKELRLKMGDAGRYYVDKEFNWESQAERFVDFVRSAAGPGVLAASRAV